MNAKLLMVADLGLLKAFRMEQHNNLYFTIWYGVYSLSTRQLRYAGAGHPPALLLGPGSACSSTALASTGPVLGCFPGTDYAAKATTVLPGSTLFLMSDGAYEITRPDGSLWTYDEFAGLMMKASAGGGAAIDELLASIRNMRGEGPLDDDFSMVQLQFPA